MFRLILEFWLGTFFDVFIFVLFYISVLKMFLSLGTSFWCRSISILSFFVLYFGVFATAVHLELFFGFIFCSNGPLETVDFSLLVSLLCIPNVFGVSSWFCKFPTLEFRLALYNKLSKLLVFLFSFSQVQLCLRFYLCFFPTSLCEVLSFSGVRLLLLLLLLLLFLLTLIRPETNL